DRGVFHLQVGGGLVGEQGRHLRGQFAEGLGAVVATTHQAQLVLDQRMGDFDDLHAGASRLPPLLHRDRDYAACCCLGPSSSARLTRPMTRSSSSAVMSKRGVKRSEFSPPWITPRPRSRSHSSLEPAPYPLNCGASSQENSRPVPWTLVIRPPSSDFSASRPATAWRPRSRMLARNSGVSLESTTQATSSARGLAVMVLP